MARRTSLASESELVDFGEGWAKRSGFVPIAEEPAKEVIGVVLVREGNVAS